MTMYFDRLEQEASTVGAQEYDDVLRPTGARGINSGEAWEPSTS